MDITIIAWVFLLVAIGYGLFDWEKKQSGLGAGQQTSDEEE